jgi:pyrroloquinoline-quinone synthase
MDRLKQRVQRVLRPAWDAIVGHPLVRAVEDGTCPTETLVQWAKEKFCAQREFSANLAYVFARMPLTDRELRSGLAANLYGERDHTDLYLGFAAALGLGADEMWEAEPLPATAAFVDRMYRLAREGSMASIAASINVGLEGVTTQHFPAIARGLRAHYGIGEDALRFFTVHDEADVEHFEHGLAVVDHYVGDDEHALDIALADARRLVHLYAVSYSAAWFHGRNHSAVDDVLASVPG